MALIFYNTLTRKKEPFIPIREGSVGMYNCGPTVYHYAHIGNLRAYIFADILRRTLKRRGFAITQIVNITDVGHLVTDADEGEDKMEKGARREGKNAKEVARFYTAAFFEDLEKLNIEKAEAYPKATEHIPDQIALIWKLEERGYAYKISDGIYFDTMKFPHYGDMARLDIAGLEEGARVAENSEKRHPIDFALWKFSRAGEKREQEWDSPWGKGFPGWHIECSAMSLKYLGETFDIHTGGIDHIPVHHTNEIAQSEAATGKKFVNVWMHSEFVNIAGGKMSKSAENFLRLKSLEDQGILPLAYRYWLLTAHYRKVLNFSEEALLGAQTAFRKLHESLFSLGKKTGRVNEEYLSKLTEAMGDDLDTPKAIALLWELSRDSRIPPESKRATFLSFDEILGLGFSFSEEKLRSLGILGVESPLRKDEIPVFVRNLVSERGIARKNKNWKKSDELREEISKWGYETRDTEEGTEIIPSGKKPDFLE